MYCSGCGSPIAPGLSFCNRCGTSLKERSSSSEFKTPAAIAALVVAMVLVAVSSMGLLLGGPIALKREGQFGEELIVLFMFLTFFISAVTEILLYRQLSRLTAQPKITFAPSTPLAAAPSAEYYAPQPQPRSLGEARTLAEPLPSVTENTTRTLEYSRNEPGRKDYS
jgi:predicted nucleic acid-binding Zn ribbon protein